MDNKSQPQYVQPQGQPQGQPQYVAVQPPQQPGQPQFVGQYAPGQQVVQQPAPVATPIAQPVPAYQQQQPMQVARSGAKSGWDSSLMDCTPCDLCLLGTFLPCMLLGQTSDRMRDPTMATAEPFNSDCLIMCAISYATGCGWIYVMIKRTEIRERFGIEGDGTSDCCAAYWCGCCALIQQEKEVKQRLPAAPIVQAYQPQPGMQMPTK